MTIFIQSLSRPTFLLLLTLLLSSCALTLTRSRPTVPLNKNHQIPLPQALFSPRTVAQLLTFKRGKDIYTLQAILKQTREHGLQVVGFTPLGMPAFGFTYDGRNISIKKLPPGLGDQFVQIILRDLMMIYSPPVWIRAKIPKSMSFYSTARLRSLELQGQRILAIKFSEDNHWKGRVSYQNFSESYEIEIQNLPTEVQ